MNIKYQFLPNNHKIYHNILYSILENIKSNERKILSPVFLSSHLLLLYGVGRMSGSQSVARF